MKKTLVKCAAALLALLLALPVCAPAFAAQYGPYEYDAFARPEGESERLPSVSLPKWQKGLYEALNKAADAFLRVFNAFYINPKSVLPADKMDTSLYLPGRSVYRKTAAQNAVWRLGYASLSLIPPDFEPGKYYIGRSLTNMPAEGVYDDNRVRVCALDDGVGDGLVIFAVADGLGVTGGDTLAVRRAVLEWARARGVKIASLNLGATHSHTALDTQGVATESIYKLLTGSVRNAFGITGEKRLENGERFKQYYVETVISAVKQAVTEMRPGRLYYKAVNPNGLIMDKRGLIAKADVPAIPVLHFIPNGGGAGAWIADIPCHPTAFDSSYHLASGDYVYFTEQRIEEKTGDRFLFMQGAAGMLTRCGTAVDTSKLPEEERMGASLRYTGKAFADLILNACGEMEPLEPVLNAKFSVSLLQPENGVLLLALKAGLVNDTAYRTGLSPNALSVPVELGYVEFGRRLGLCLFPVELYPEVFYGTSIINDGDYDAVSWENRDFSAPVPALLAPAAGVDMFAAHLMNDSLGYCVPDVDYAFLGHVIADDNADESLSLGKTTASKICAQFEALMQTVG